MLRVGSTVRLNNNKPTKYVLYAKKKQVSFILIIKDMLKKVSEIKLCQERSFIL